MTNDKSRSSADVVFRPVGMGMAIIWRCFGCSQSRQTLGSKGAGVHKRCKQCVAARDERKGKA